MARTPRRALLRAFVAIVAVLALLAAVRLVRVIAAGDDTLVSREVHVFGSLTTITLAGLDDSAAAPVLDQVERQLNEWHRTLHPWEPSALSAINDAFARGEPARAPEVIRELVSRSTPLVTASGGRFDPGVGEFVRQYGFHTSDFPITTHAPDATAVAAMRGMRPSLLQVTVDGDTVRSANPHVRLDFNAVAEGYAAARIAGLVRASGAKGALISLGGDVLALGDANGRAWRVALRDPDGGVLGTLALRDGEALFSSGGYGRYREVAGTRWPHVIDPRTAEPARGVLATAVLGRDPIVADAAATALMSARDEFVATARAMGVESALIVDDDGAVQVFGELASRVDFRTKRVVQVR